MADLQIDPRFIQTVETTAAYKAAQAVAQRMSPAVVQDVQRLLQLGNFVSGVFGLGGDFSKKKMPLMGGMSPADARHYMQQIRDARPARKNLFYIRVTDPNPPDIGYKFPKGTSAAAMFDLFAIEVTYSQWTIQGEKVAIGSVAMDKPITSESIDLTITAMDDEAGTLKRWFEGKCAQLAHPDGTFGLPSEYWVDIEVVHAVASPDVAVNKPPYKVLYRMRPVSVSHDLSHRDQAIEERQFTFTQFDTFQQP